MVSVSVYISGYVVIPFQLPLLYGGQYIFIAMYLMIHSSAQLFVLFIMIIIGNTKQISKKSHLCNLGPLLKS